MTADTAIASLEYLSEENYVKQAKHGTPLCPNCKSGEGLVEEDDLTTVDCDSIDVGVGCQMCGCSWIERYELTGYYAVVHRKEG